MREPTRWKVIQWSTGTVGREALRALIRDPNLELVGVFAHAPEKAGRDANELAGIPGRSGITATGVGAIFIRRLSRADS